MQRFILEQNIARFRARLAESHDEATRERLRVQLAKAERDLALVETRRTGVRASSWPAAVAETTRRTIVTWFHRTFQRSHVLAALIDPGPGLVIVEVNPTYLAVTGRTREQVADRPLFEAFPDNPEDPHASGVRNLYASLRRVAETGREDKMPNQRYDVLASNGRYVERYWRPTNTPLHDEAGRLAFILHLVTEVTEEVIGEPAEL